MKSIDEMPVIVQALIVFYREASPIAKIGVTVYLVVAMAMLYKIWVIGC